MMPGATQLTLTPFPTHSKAMLLVRFSTPARAAPLEKGGGKGREEGREMIVFAYKNLIGLHRH